jgi:hypothetical protein
MRQNIQGREFEGHGKKRVTSGWSVERQLSDGHSIETDHGKLGITSTGEAGREGAIRAE